MRRIRTFELSALGALALAAQLALVAGIAALGAAEAVLLAALGWLFAAPCVHRLDLRGARLLAMQGVGGLGMALGWWIDLGFRAAPEAALVSAAGIDTLWCGSVSSALPAGAGFAHLVSWMSAGMLAFGLPIAALRPCPAPQLRCALGMLLGSAAGAWLAAQVAAGLDPGRAALVCFASMSLGMGAGTLALERGLAPRGLRRAPLG